MKWTITAAFLAIFALSLAATAPVIGDCPLAHTHIGKNPTWRPDWNDPGNPDLATDPDPTDDNKLWFFSIPPIDPLAPTPGWPNWGDPVPTENVIRCMSTGRSVAQRCGVSWARGLMDVSRNSEAGIAGVRVRSFRVPRRPCRKCVDGSRSSRVAVMQPADVRDRDDATVARRLDLAGEWRIAVER